VEELLAFVPMDSIDTDCKSTEEDNMLKRRYYKRNQRLVERLLAESNLTCRSLGYTRIEELVHINNEHFS